MIDKSGEICDSAEERTDVMEIGVKLKEARIKSGLTQENVAEKIQVSRQTISINPLMKSIIPSCCCTQAML